MTTENISNEQDKIDNTKSQSNDSSIDEQLKQKKSQIAIVSILFNLLVAYLFLEIIFELKIDDFIYSVFPKYGALVLFLLIIVILYYTIPKTKERYRKYLRDKAQLKQ